jgi:transposase
VSAHRPGALERAGLAMADWHDTLDRLATVEASMAAVLDNLGLTELVTTIAGLTAVGAAAIVAETGDPSRFTTPRDRWSSTPGCARVTTPPAATRARPRSPAAAGPACR